MTGGKHTEGPWRFCVAYESEREVPFDYVGPGYYDNPAIIGADGETVVGCDEYYVFSTPENVALIAAAPELYEALTELMAAFREYTKTPTATALSRVRHAEIAADRALAAAEGRTDG